MRYILLVVILTNSFFCFSQNEYSMNLRYNNCLLACDDKVTTINMCFTDSENELNKNIWAERIVPIYMITMGVGIAGIWTANILGGQLDVKGNFFQWRDESGQLYWPHVTSEYLISGALITGGIGLINKKQWSLNFSLISLGALFNTSLNSLGWAFAEKERYSNSIPMLMGLTGSVVSMKIIINYKKQIN